VPVAEMDSFQFSDHLDSEPEVALGLTAPRLGLAAFGAVAAWALTELPVPAPVRLGAGSIVAITASTLAWGRIQGVSLARWSWLAVRYAGRAFGSPADRDHSIDQNSGVIAASEGRVIDPYVVAVAFLALRPRTGCSSVCRAVASELEAMRAMAWLPPEAGPVPRLILHDWGSRQWTEPRGGRVIGLVLVWDGLEAYPGQLEAALETLRCAHPLAFRLTALNRAGPAAGLSSRIAGAGARLVCSIPTDPSLGKSAPRPAAPSRRPSEEGVRALAGAVLVAAKTW
jgi:hypothetical protein